MWLAFKALSWKLKAGILAGLLVILAALIGSTAYVSYQKGLNVSKVEIQKYAKRSQELQYKLAVAQSKVDVRVVTQYKDRVAEVDRVVYKTRTVVVDSVPEQFSFSKGWVYSYNQSVQGLEVDPILASDATPSTVSDLRALADTIVPNNGVYLANKAKLDALQQWIRETEVSRAQVTNSN